MPRLRQGNKISKFPYLHMAHTNIHLYMRLYIYIEYEFIDSRQRIKINDELSIA